MVSQAIQTVYISDCVFETQNAERMLNLPLAEPAILETCRTGDFDLNGREKKKHTHVPIRT